MMYHKAYENDDSDQAKCVKCSKKWRVRSSIFSLKIVKIV